MSFRFVKYVGLFSLGALSSLPFTYTEWWWLTLLCLALLFAAIQTDSVKGACMAVFGYTLGWMLAGIWWLYISLHSYGDMSVPMAGLTVLVLCLILNSFYTAATAFAFYWKTDSASKNAVLLSSCWLLGELLRGYIFTGFPWLSIGYSQVDGPLAHWAPWIGVYGLGFIANLIAALGAIVIRVGFRLEAFRPALGVLLVLGFSLCLPVDFTQSQGQVRASLLQPQVDQGIKFTHEHLNNTLQGLEAQLQASQGDVVVTPETMIPLLLSDVPPAIWSAYQKPFASRPRVALLGVPIGVSPLTYTNSMIAFGSGIESHAEVEATASAALAHSYAFRYDKQHLVPFGEFTPKGFGWLSRLMNISMTSFVSGDSGSAILPALGQRWAPLICFEDLFGEEVAVRFKDPTRAPTVLVNASNLAWFGLTIALDQHLHIARMRSLEFERPMIRATNTGPTVIIDHKGEVSYALPRTARGILEGVVEGRAGMTPYARWASHFGLWPLTLVVLAMLLGVRYRRSRL